VVNDGSAGYAFDGDPTASFAIVTLDGAAPAPRSDGEDDEDDVEDGRTAVTAEIHRADYDVLAVSNAISARGLPGDVYRAATVRTGKLVR
jgi:hypothetical protein